MAYLLNGSKLVASSKLLSVFERDPNKGEELVHELCDQLLDPTRFEERSDRIQWLKALISEDETFEKFSTKVQNMDSSPFCGCVWTANFVAYRCRTCAASPCMSLCAACFERGNHEGHDYNIFRSEAGGACDCGDPSVMKQSGFCSHHGPNRLPPEQAPAAFLSAGKVMLDRIILAMIHTLRKFSSSVPLQETFIVNFPKQAEEFFAFILELVKLGSPIRTHVTQLLLNEKLYQELMLCKGYKSVENTDSSTHKFHKISISWFLHSLKCVKQPVIPPDIPDKGQFQRSEEYKNYLDEITFWIVRYEFPESVILVILNLLPDPDMKREFSKAFTRHYSRIATSLSNSAKVDQLSTRVVHISVQLFSNDDLAYMLAVEEHLLQIFVVSTFNIIDPSLQASNTTDKDFHQCVSTAGSDLRTNAYWPIVSDFVNVLSHPRVARMFLADYDLVSSWVQQLTCFSGMDLIRREIGTHIEYEPTNALIAFYTEREACASPLWSMLDVLQFSAWFRRCPQSDFDQGRNLLVSIWFGPNNLSTKKIDNFTGFAAKLSHTDTADLSINVIRILLDAMTEFFDALGFDGNPPLPHDQISFHYPLHRYLAHFLCNAIKSQALEIKDIGIEHEEVIKLMAHPLQVITTMHEVQVGMWVRNGLYISTQALAYKQYFFCTFFLDADLYLLQFCASIISPDLFVASIFERCRVTGCLTMSDSIPSSSDGGPTGERAPKMLEGAFNILLSVLGIRIHLGIPDEEVIRSETVVLLTSQACTYSTLSDHIPQCHESHSGLKSRHYTALLAQSLDKYAVKKEGNAMDQTTYLLNKASWSHYDPVFTEHRTLYKKVVQQAHTNYFNNLRDTGQIPQQGITEATLWPPYQPLTELPPSYSGLTRLLHCRTTHAFIYVILFKALHNHSAVSETTLAMALHLVEAALSLKHKVTPETHGPSSPDMKRSKVEESWYKLFHSWFESEDMLVNIMKTIDFVQAPTFSSDVVAMEVSEEGNPTDNPINSRKTKQKASLIHTGESILSMLVKLHDKFHGSAGTFKLDENKLHSRQRSPVVPSTPTNVISNVLHVAASKTNELRLIIEVIAKSLSPRTAPESSPDAAGSSADAEKMNRRRQAKEARMRMMMQLEIKQKQFMENVDMTDLDSPNEKVNSSNESNDAPFNTSPLADESDPPAKYECVICGAVETELASPSIIGTPNREQKLMGVICLAQPTTVLGHRSDTPSRMSPFNPGSPPISTPHKSSYRYFVDKRNSWLRLSSYKHIVEDTMVDHAVGTHISTCGHHVHFACHKVYIESVSPPEMLSTGRDSKHGFQCPMCRQMSNLILPCNVRYRRTGDARSELPSDINILNACSETAANITSISRPCDGIFPFHSALDLLRVVRVNLEQNLLQLGNTLLAPQVPISSSPRAAASQISRKLPIGPLFYLFQRINIGLLESNSDKSIQELIDNVMLLNPSKRTKRDIPLLLHDPVSLLLKITASRPPSLTQYRLHVQLLYNLAYVKSLLHVCTKFSREERRAWKSNVSTSLGGIPFSPTDLNCLLGLVIQNLNIKTFKSEDSTSVFGNRLGYLTTVFSPQSVVSTVEHSLLPFLRIATLFQSHIFNQHPIPIESESRNEFAELVHILNLSPTNKNVTATQCLKWESAWNFITRWCKEINEFVESDVVISRQLISSNKEWYPPKLIELPHDYSALFQRYRQVVCDKCKLVPKDPAICLVCGSYICYKSSCKPEDGDADMQGTMSRLIEADRMLRQGNAATRHSKRCGAGTCILLLVNSSIVVVIRGTRACIWGTLYLDAHGEEDKGWKRGKPLFLKKERSELLERQWIQHSFDNSCKNWAAHRQTL